MRRGILIQAQERGATSRRFCAFVPGMGNDFLDIPDDLEALRAALIVERGRRIAAKAEAAAVKAKVSSAEALIAHLKLQIEKLRREFFGARSERTARLIEQMELQLEELETSASQDDLAAEQAAARAGTTQVAAFTRKRPARKPFPEHLPRERVIVPGPTNCACCGSLRLARLGEDVTETLEVVPRQWKVIQHVREKFTCRDCESISQAPACVSACNFGSDAKLMQPCVSRLRQVGLQEGRVSRAHTSDA